MPKKTIDVQQNNQVIQQQVVVEDAIGTDIGAFSPARAIQYAGNLVSSSNRFPVESTRADATPITEAALAAVGSTTARSVANYRYYSYQVQVTGIGTNVVLRMEGTHLASPATSAEWYSLQGNNVDTTITANGSYKFQISGETDLQVRMTLVSFSGGTPSVVCTLIRGN